MKYIYPAIFTPLDNGEYYVCAPDLPYCRTCGHNLAEAVEMAEDAVSMWLWDAENKSEDIPVPSKSLSYDPPQFISFIKADTSTFRRNRDNQAVKKALIKP
jgi:predicted RNase H-like HicB family nuclease